MGQHPICDECWLKKRALKACRDPVERVALIEQLSLHYLENHLNRMFYNNMVEMSMKTSQALANGKLFSQLSRELSQAAMSADGVDQAKFKVPRDTDKPQKLPAFIRPAMHVQGVWMNGFGYHFALSDADQKKHTK